MMTDNLCRKCKLADSFIPCGNDIGMTCQIFFFFCREVGNSDAFVRGNLSLRKDSLACIKLLIYKQIQCFERKKNIPPPNQSSVKNVEFQNT